MKTNKKPGSQARQNYLLLLYVFVTFALMALAAYIFIGKILRDRLMRGAEDLLQSAEANVKAGLSEAETTLLNSYYIVQGMVERNAPREEILDYLTVTTDWMRRWDHGLLDFYGVYGYIHGEFYDSIGMNPGDDFIPQRRPWYQAAVRSGSIVAYTSPYIDWHTGDTIVSASRNIDMKNGDIAGILAVDINIGWLVEYVSSLALAVDGYGMLLSQNMTLTAHPDASVIGRQLQELGGSYEEIARILRSGNDVFAHRINDPSRGPVIVFFKRIFNDWYVGIITPYSQFYRDLNSSAQILAVLGIVFSLSLCFLLLRLLAAKLRSDEESKSKSSFLASMSHEIRTPMNAITGMAELLLRGELSDEARSYAQDIKQAGNNLISIINDILDFSKIEAGRLEIVPAKYMLSSLINDTVNIIRMRLVEKPIRFFTNIDSYIPNSLIGDEVRIRQILLNLLSNAVKYSEKGHIGLSITEKKRESGQVWLEITVEDTGKGIRPEDQARLFGEFVQVDAKTNRGIEGTGLGLAITKRLCIAMGGDITVESEYGNGSKFIASILQGIDSETPFAAVEDPAQKKILVYEGRSVYAKSVCWSLDNMLVPYTLVTKHEDFIEALNNQKWFYVFSAYSFHEKIKPLLENPSVPNMVPPLALMVEWGTEAYIPNVRFLHLPVQTLSIANILNGKLDSKDSIEPMAASSATLFSLKHTRLLVVDDIITNLKVAEGLLAPYNATVDTCSSGARAIELVKERYYDILFMDHMMPGMDGLETTAVIRGLEGEYFKTIPIIALTANAVLGMREMFIEEGFNDFLAKPIEVSKLEEILDRWIPKEKKEWGKKNGKTGTEKGPSAGLIPNSPFPAPHPQFPAIPGLDTKRGIVLTGGTEAGYRNVLSFFCKDVADRMPTLLNMPGIDTLSQFVTQVHALKSASGSIGSEELSKKAENLEAAGKAGDLAFIEKNLGGFVEHLVKLTEDIKTALEAGKTEGTEVSHSSSSIPLPLLNGLGAALKSQKVADIDRILEGLMKEPLDSKTRETLEKISDNVLMTEFDGALETLGSLLEGPSGK